MRAGRLLDGFLTTQLLYVAAKLGVADVLADGPRTGAEVAEAVGADPELAGAGPAGLALEEQDGGRFALTEIGACLRSDVPGSLRGPAVVRGELYYQAAAGTLAAVRDGGRRSSRSTGTGSSTTWPATRSRRPPSRRR